MSEKLYYKAIAEAMMEEMQRDSEVIYVGEDVGVFGGALAKAPELYQTFGPNRVIDTPLCENGIVSFCVGAALAGKRPVAELMFADFAALAFDPIVNGAAKQRYLTGGQKSVPLVIRTGQGVGTQCGPQHTQCIEAWFMNTPGLKVAVPSTPYDVKGLLKYAIRNDDPVLFLEARMSYYTLKEEIPEEDYVIPFGEARIAREGTDVTIVAWHKLLHDSMKAAVELEKEGISVEIIDPRTLVPFDKETVIESIKKTGKLIIAHEAPKRGGAAGEISAIMAEEAFEYLERPIMRVAGDDLILPTGITEFELVPDEKDVIKAVKEMVKESKLNAV